MYTILSLIMIIGMGISAYFMVEEDNTKVASSVIATGLFMIFTIVLSINA